MCDKYFCLFKHFVIFLTIFDPVFNVKIENAQMFSVFGFITCAYMRAKRALYARRVEIHRGRSPHTYRKSENYLQPLTRKILSAGSK